VNFRDIAADGLWHHNPALVQLLGLCPLLAVSTSVVTALGLGLTTLVVLTASNLTISLIRRFLDDSTRLPAQIMVIATFVTLADILLAAALFGHPRRLHDGRGFCGCDRRDGCRPRTGGPGDAACKHGSPVWSGGLELDTARR